MGDRANKCLTVDKAKIQLLIIQGIISSGTKAQTVIATNLHRYLAGAIIAIAGIDRIFLIIILAIENQQRNCN